MALDRSRWAVWGADRLSAPELGSIVPVQSAVALIVTGVGPITGKAAVTVGNEIEAWGNERCPALSTVPSAVPVMPEIGIGPKEGDVIVSDPANATFTGPGLLTVAAPAGAAVNTAAPPAKTREDPTMAATVTKRVSLK
jgi:hypothetical protein